jgi:hypothetical protein
MQTQAQAPTKTGYGINWYGGPVVNSKQGMVVSHHSHKRQVYDVASGSASENFEGS